MTGTEPATAEPAPQAPTTWTDLTPTAFGMTKGTTIPMFAPADPVGTLDLFDSTEA